MCDFVEVEAHILGFDIAQRQQPAGEDVVGRTAGNTLRLVGGADAGRARLRAHAFQQGLERRPVGVFGGVAGLEVGGNRIGIGKEKVSIRKSHENVASLPARRHPALSAQAAGCTATNCAIRMFFPHLFNAPSGWASMLARLMRSLETGAPFFVL